MHRIAHIQDGVVINVTMASNEWLQKNQSDAIFECPDDAGIGYTYDPDLDVFIAPTTP